MENDGRRFGIRCCAVQADRASTDIHPDVRQKEFITINRKNHGDPGYVWCAGWTKIIRMKNERIERGERFGRLTCEAVVKHNDFGGAIWKCVCDCGTEIEVSESKLVCGIIKSCGCRSSHAIDLQGQRFGMLTVLEPVPERGMDGSVCWLCRCDCGKYLTQSANKLRMGRSVSCGCQTCVAAQESKTYIDGTCVEIMLSERIPKNNTSGIKGVARKRNKWQAYINYGGKRISLGNFDTKELAGEARQAAEQKIREHLDVLMNSPIGDMADGPDGTCPVHPQ